jgi:hypothetical protein
MRDAIHWEASYQCWCRRAALTDHPGYRDIWAGASLAVRVQQAERWLRLARTHGRPRHAASSPEAARR